jgi:hypothetical protein
VDRADASLVRSCVLALAILLAGAEPAFAFCRTTTCDPKTRVCAKDANKCIVDGVPLRWVERCLSFAVQEDGSARRNITYRAADDVIRKAFIQWVSADCGGQPPSFKMWDIGEPHGGVACREPEFNETQPNANVWMFKDDTWSHENETSTLAVTTVMFEQSTGIILGADVEVNSFARNLTITDDPSLVKEDLQSIATHEAGHFLGLSHSLVPYATMNAEYNQGDLTYRTIHDDDRAGICAIYPPDRDAPACDSPHPPHGFSLYCHAADEPGDIAGCDCRVPARARSSAPASGALGGALLGLTLLVFRRRFAARRGGVGSRH